MVYYEDLSPYSYLPDTVPSDVIALNVGWLDARHEFPTGFISHEFVECIGFLCATSVDARTRGWHACEISHGDFPPGYPVSVEINGNKLSLGGAEIRILSVTGDWFIAPDLVLHYIRDHGYRPPEEFVKATLSGRIAPAVGSTGSTD